MKRQFDLLIIDDEQVVLDAIQRICHEEKYLVDTALDAVTSLEKIKKNDYKLVICDLMLPDSNGFKILNFLSDNKLDIPVIMMTGYSTMENAVSSLNSGAIDFIPKPFTADELYSAIRRGFSYLDLKEREKTLAPGSICYVPCPAKYYRLGYVTWIATEVTGYVHVGITDLFLKTIQSLAQIELLSENQELIQGSYCASIRSEDGLPHAVLSPVSGRILEKNPELSHSCTLLEKDPYFRGWLYKVLPSDYDYEIKNLISCKLDMF